MKKLMMAMAAAAMVGAANAEASYHYLYNAFLTPYEDKDAKPSDDHASWYSGYGMTQATAQDLLDTTKTVTYSDVAKWLGNNFADNSAAVVEYSQAFDDYAHGEYDTGFGQYWFAFTKGSNFEANTDDYIGVVFFDNGTDLAYNVLSANGQKSYFDFDDQGASSSSGWQAVPEPTSGLLMLLGMAGLCLRRKQRV